MELSATAVEDRNTTNDRDKTTVEIDSLNAYEELLVVRPVELENPMGFKGVREY